MWMRLASLLSALSLLALFLAAILFYIHNDDAVTLDLYVYQLTWPLAHVVLGALAIGVALGWAVSVVSGWLWRVRQRRRQREARASQAAIEAMNTPPDPSRG